MNQVNILSDAISDVADEFIFEAYEYIPSGFRKNVKKLEDWLLVFVLWL